MNKIRKLKKTALLSCCLFTLLFVLPLTVMAQTPGLKVGAGAIHPRVSVKTDYGTNVNRASKDNNPTSDLILNFVPGVTMNIPSKNVKFLLNLEANYARYLGIKESSTKDFSNLAAKLFTDVVFFPNGPFSITINDSFVRSDDPASNSLNQRFGNFYNRSGLLFDIKPGGGALSFQLGGGFKFSHYDSKNEVNYLNNQTVSAGALLKWKFFPKTAFILSADYAKPLYPAEDTYNYFNEDTLKSDSVDFKTPGANSLKSHIGLVGQFSPKLSLNVKAGYGSSFSTLDGDNQNYGSVIGHTDIIYYFTRTAILQVGFTRSFDLTPLYGFIDINMPYLLFNLIIADRYNFGLKGEFKMSGYGRPPSEVLDAKGETNFSEEDRKDNIIRASLPISIAILRWLYIDVAFAFQNNNSNIDRFSYNAADFSLGVRAEY